ncbi:MAG TPA: 4-alpha-glucanotransferase, partial [Myxococcota bacterium]|nr:4-alpha-glucanotransferase [Myxococcota bacterium]
MGPGETAERRAGVLLHVTSLPGPYGVGDVGPSARQALAWMEAAGQRIWQMLPVNPTDRVGSPYAAPSSLARNPLLLSIDDLVDDGWLRHAEKPWASGSPFQVRFDEVETHKGRALRLAGDRMVAAGLAEPFAAENPWVIDWALFATLVRVHGAWWTRWPAELRERDPAALAAVRDRYADDVRRHVALQAAFERQWSRLRAEARARGVALWGDVPFFVGGESCDVWAHRDLFRLDAAGLPTVVSGVPPDAFSADGQYWGTPLYDVPSHAAEGYRWWCERIGATAALFDEVRVDHFRGLAGVWEIPRGAKATEGRWIDSFGAPLLDALRSHLGGLPLIAEDLGIITPDVEALRDDHGLPGMVILQFAFSDASRPGLHPYLPHNHRAAQVVYPGTHDNPTAVGWYEAADERTRDHFRRYLSVDGRSPAGDLLRASYRSVARDAVIPMQDLLGLGADARMNTPGREDGNWAWRCGAEAFQVS